MLDAQEIESWKELVDHVVNPAYFAVFLATEKIAETPIQSGDLVIKGYSGQPTALIDERTRGSWSRLSRSCFTHLADQIDHLKQLHAREHCRPRTRQQFKSYLTNARVLQAKDESSPVLILRPLRSPVSRPIRARSDAGAIFELLCQVSERDTS